MVYLTLNHYIHTSVRVTLTLALFELHWFQAGVDMGDHPPITPCRLAKPTELHGNEV